MKYDPIGSPTGMFQPQAQDGISYPWIKAAENGLLWPLISGFDLATIPLPSTPVANTFFGVSCFDSNALIAFSRQVFPVKQPLFFNTRSTRHFISFRALCSDT
jgi:hypothetical protein